MPDSNRTASADRGGRIRSTGFLNSIGIEPTTTVLLVGMSVLLFALVSIIGLERSPEPTLDEEQAPATETYSETVEVLVAPQAQPAVPSE